MPWTKTNYPVSMKNLSVKVRTKAIQIANAMLHDWRFWVGLSLCLIATIYYIMSVDFFLRPRQAQQSSENNTTP